jgi:hypothetical protein
MQYESSMVPAPARTVGARAARQLDEALAAAASNGVVFLESVADLSKEVRAEIRTYAANPL